MPKAAIRYPRFVGAGLHSSLGLITPDVRVVPANLETSIGMSAGSSRWLSPARLFSHKPRWQLRARRTSPSPFTRVGFRPISTTRALRDESEAQEAVKAAPEIDMDLFTATKDRLITEDTMEKLRVIPASPSYFTARPQYTDDLLMLRSVLREFQTLPICKRGEAPRVAWRTLESYKSAINGEPIRSTRFARMLDVARRLNYIHPSVRPPQVTKAIMRFARDMNPQATRAKPILIDEWGRARAVGRRKSSTASVWLVEGEGEFMINGKTLADAFGRVHDRESVMWALKSTDRIDKYNVWAIVKGGGTTGQAEALTNGIAKALIAHEPLLKAHLRRGGYCRCYFERRLKANTIYSGNRGQRSASGREEEARPGEGTQDADLGQALSDGFSVSFVRLLSTTAAYLFQRRATPSPAFACSLFLCRDISRRIYHTRSVY